MNTNRNSILAAILVFLLGPVPAVQATTLARMSLDELAAAAHVIVEAYCLENEARWERGEIWTFTNLEVTETIKGVAPRLITVRLLGGRVGHLISTVNGVPRFQPGEDVVLFLERTPAGDFSVTSWVQGTFRIRRDPQTGRKAVTQDSAGAGVFDPATRRFHTSGIRNLPVEVFRQRLAETLERQSRGR